MWNINHAAEITHLIIAGLSHNYSKLLEYQDEKLYKLIQINFVLRLSPSFSLENFAKGQFRRTGEFYYKYQKIKGIKKSDKWRGGL